MGHKESNKTEWQNNHHHLTGLFEIYKLIQAISAAILIIIHEEWKSGNPHRVDYANKFVAYLYTAPVQ